MLEEIQNLIHLAERQRGYGIRSAVVDSDSSARLIVEGRARERHIRRIAYTLIVGLRRKQVRRAAIDDFPRLIQVK